VLPRDTLQRCNTWQTIGSASIDEGLTQAGRSPVASSCQRKTTNQYFTKDTVSAPQVEQSVDANPLKQAQLPEAVMQVPDALQLVGAKQYLPNDTKVTHRSIK
jgi:hypothetical protein